MTQGLVTSPFVDLVSVQFASLRERVNEERFDALADAGSERGRSIRGNLLGEVESLGSDLVRGVLRDSVVEAPDIAVSVFSVGGLVPDFPHAIAHSGGHRLAHYETVQNLVTLRLRQTSGLPIREDLASLDHAGQTVLQSMGREIQIQRLRVLLHQREGRAFEHRNLHTVGAEEAEEPDIQSDLQRTIEGILNHDLEARHIALAHPQFDVGEAELGSNLSALVDDLEALALPAMTRGAEEGFKLREQDAVLHRGVSFADHTENIARVLADGGEGGGGSPVGEVETLQRDFKVHAVEGVHDL